MKKFLILGFVAVLAACGGNENTGGASGSMDTPQAQHDSGVNPWLAGALGYAAGRMTAPSAQPQNNVVAPTVVNRTIVNKTIVVKEAPKPAAPVAAPASPPKQSYAPKQSYQAPSRPPSVTYRSAPTSSGRR